MPYYGIVNRNALKYNTLQLPAFMFYHSCFMKKRSTKNMHPLFGEILTFTSGEKANFYDIETQASFTDYIDVSNYLSI